MRRLQRLSPEQIRQIREYEKCSQRRKSLLVVLRHRERAGAAARAQPHKGSPM